ncbi:Nonsense-mediated mRNA decay protein 5 [Friedmanniomyces endolithicus]|nr:Nonsense-mediated mRNA decay protein 5 [Friedmanniomyces endolithicus]KAK0785355.1 Nonsense-mediated mRNA decay protein 5 [Friedmanniomyces endolithicus]KAK0812369.1 Nonsense-mediated mRNA decay protein 5 [Friedmanniomyces endolithicus]KAK0833311.1 Nonsense-mediated mRNA decay protein 5 [Friedmanniomyces endolithicus]KAK0862267.1 Nonsense-mediated mRNA decay protein 5 [Friedmanniomyces endolithicus]
MDAAGLRHCIQGTLSPDANTRQQAETELKAAEETPGLLDALLNILSAEQDNGIRLSTVVYFKNRVNKGWVKAGDTQPPNSITEQEKATVRARLVPTLATAQPNARAQLVVALQKILHCDFPKHWPDFVDITVKLLHAQDVQSVFAGLQCLLAICRTYRFKLGDSRGDFDQIVATTFPQLLNIGNSLAGEESIEAGEMLRTVLKAYKHAVYFELPMHLRAHGAMVDWCTLFLRVVAKDPPASSMLEDLDERELNHWWKCKKWAYVNLNRLFVRYGNPASLAKGNGEDYTEFAKSFISTFAPEILKGYLVQIEKWVQKQTWLSKPCLSHTLAFMDECVKPKQMWDHLRPHMPILIRHLVFPVLCQSDEDLEQFDDEPAEYLHRKLNFYEEVSAPDVAATNFLVTLTKARRKQTFEILTFINEIVNRYEAAPDDQKNPREKEGALRMIGTLANVILGKKSPIADQVEYFFVRHIFPEFRSPHGFLRARACDTLEKFESLDFKDPNNLTIIYRNILESMADEALPVRVEAALALQPLIRHDPIRQMMQQNIPQIMQQLLKLANEVDVDALANVMEDFVEVFAAELTPFAVALTEQLRDTYVRIVKELIDRNELRETDEGYGDFLDDKSITALGVLQTIGTLILTLESTPDVLAHLETILMPVIAITLEHKLYDLYNEIFEIIDSCTFAAKTISPTMWQAFELIHQTFKTGAELYLEDMLPALENFVNYGHGALLQNPAYLECMVDMICTIFKDDKVGGVDRICGCKLAEILMLNLRGGIDDRVPEFIQLAMRVLTSDELKIKSYRIHLMEMVINAVYYNPRLSLNVLEANGWTNKFFSLWFSSIDSFTRVHDKKLSIGAITALLTLRGDEVPHSVQQGWPRLLQGIVRLFQTLPAAMKNREEAQREEDFGLGGDYEEDEEEDEAEWEHEDWQQEESEAETTDVKDESTAYLDFLSQQAAKFNSAVGEDEADDELEEESLLETPLDQMEPYGLFKTALHSLSQQDPTLYAQLTATLGPEEQQVIKGAIEKADHVAAQQAALQEQQANGGDASGVQQQQQPHTNGAG